MEFLSKWKEEFLERFPRASATVNCVWARLSKGSSAHNAKIVLLCIAITVIGLFFQKSFQSPDASDQAVLLSLIIVGYLTGFLHGSDAKIWGAIFFFINMLVWIIGAARLYSSLHPA